eukprot:CAMPEP_0173410030 /NCGR_PEP_ID=MMETSP1356-20130122/73617_1 /TAXON_ID=77927 ORGANISM="Hemiselmis virescens, Strain PCC157" /NCGR_SAMPLE_ID=MMETSP1356 /ASSEMBLY_ACC=CAM_ASM_000847 /LENGTH=126 /DNA_ID=CAMNT_0014371603 /DNA_START=28 /DNA_END=404 /DNA_ORIENTATION=+
MASCPKTHLRTKNLVSGGAIGDYTVCTFALKLPALSPHPLKNTRLFALLHVPDARLLHGLLVRLYPVVHKHVVGQENVAELPRHDFSHTPVPSLCPLKNVKPARGVVVVAVIRLLVPPDAKHAQEG